MAYFWLSVGARIDQNHRGGDAWDAPDYGSMHNSSQWDVNIESLKGKIEAITGESQLATTKLQQTINKYNQTFEMVSSFVSKYFQSIGTVIQNLR